MASIDFDVADENSPGTHLTIFSADFQNADGEESDYVARITTVPHLIRSRDEKLLGSLVEMVFKGSRGTVAARIIMDPHSALELASAIKTAGLILLESK
jgi:hypothetical protein